MTAPRDPRVPLEPEPPVDDLSIVPGLGPAGGLPAPRQELPGSLDPALDPDRYDPDRDDPPAPVGGLDPALDPDRYAPERDLPPGQGQTLTELLGEGAHEDSRDGWEWAYGLLVIVAFLALVSWFFGSVASP